jgi:ectoine hydroxylase
MVAVDRAHCANGALNVLRGSHKLGRLEHSRVVGGGGRREMEADPDRVALAEGACERVVCELGPGDALFFHCNTLHCSGPNSSADPRWALICCYNTDSNKVPSRTQEASARDAPVRDQPIPRWDDSCLLEFGRRQLAAL